MTGTTFLPPFLDFLLLPFEKKLETVIQMRRFVKFSAVCTIKKGEKHPWRSNTFSKVEGFSQQLY